MAQRARTDASGRLVPATKRDGVRWLTLLDGPAAAAYATGVARVAGRIETRLVQGVMANRVLANAPLRPGDPLPLEPWRSARRRFLREARRLAAGSGAVLVADIRDCYPSIAPATVEQRLRKLGCDDEAIRALVDLLREFERRGIPGLPVGPEPSAVLANGVLEAADRAVASGGGVHLRWVDDFVVFVEDAAHAVDILHRLREALEALGLALSEAKTGVVAPSDLGVLELSGIRPRL